MIIGRYSIFKNIVNNNYNNIVGNNSQRYYNYIKYYTTSNSNSIIIPTNLTPIEIDPNEKKLFDYLKNVLGHNKRNDIELRVAGGWVRDKLLNIKKSKSEIDIDIALNKISGFEFVNMIQDYRKFLKDEKIKRYLIKMNPDKSKHLETASINLFDFQIDFNSLRSDDYVNATHSRIPQIKIGTPLSDSQRRDLTINSLYYNLNSNMVEDQTGLGLNDLSNKLIRTPLSPESTLSDDPLRAFRVIRFATKFNFKIDTPLYNCLKSLKRETILNKVSMERINKEFSMIMGIRELNVVYFKYLIDTGLIYSVFNGLLGVLDESTCNSQFIQSMECIKLSSFDHYYPEQLDFYITCIFAPFFINGKLSMGSIEKVLRDFRCSNNQILIVKNNLTISILFNQIIIQYFQKLNNNDHMEKLTTNGLESFLIGTNEEVKSMFFNLLLLIRLFPQRKLFFALDISKIHFCCNINQKHINSFKIDDLNIFINQFISLLNDKYYQLANTTILVNGHEIQNMYRTKVTKVNINDLMKSILFLQIENPNFKKEDILNWVQSNINRFLIKK